MNPTLCIPLILLSPVTATNASCCRQAEAHEDKTAVLEYGVGFSKQNKTKQKASFWAQQSLNWWWSNQQSKQGRILEKQFYRKEMHAKFLFYCPLSLDSFPRVLPNVRFYAQWVEYGCLLYPNVCFLSQRVAFLSGRWQPSMLSLPSFSSPLKNGSSFIQPWAAALLTPHPPINHQVPKDSQ